MTYPKIRVLFKAFLLLVLLLPASCKKDSKPQPEVKPPTETTGPKLSITNSSVEGYQLVNVAVTDYALSQTTYDLKVGGKDVKGFNNNDGTLSFIIPGDLPTGTYDIKATFTTNALSVTVQAPATVADPAKTLKDITDKISVEVVALSADTAVATNEKTALNQIKANLDDAMQKFNALSAADKQVTAQYLAVNLKGLDEGEKLMDDMNNAKQALMQARLGNKMQINQLRINDNCDIYCYFDQVVKVVGFAALLSAGVTTSPLILTAGAVALGVNIGYSIATGRKSIAAAKIKKLIEEGISWAYFPQIKYLDAVFQDAYDKLGIIKTTSITATQLNILKGEPVTFQLKPVYRTIQRTDATTNPIIAQFVNVYDALRPKFNAAFGSVFGSLPDYSNKEEKRDAKKLEEWQIKITAGTATATAPTGTASSFNVTFNSASTEKQTLEFDVIFHGPTGDISDHVAATLITHRQAYKAVITGGNNQGGEFGKLLPKKLEVTVTDSKSMPVENASVSWTTAGGGTITTQSTTNAQGIAQADWTLGASGTQTAQASIKNDVGADVQGSPVAFAATEAFANSIAISAGNHQDGQLGKKLDAPIAVKVLAVDGSVLGNAKVEWFVLSGGGTVSAAETLTDAQGVAQVNWTLGNSGVQKVQATAKKKDGTLVQNAPVIFEAGTGQDQSATYAAAVLGTYVISYPGGPAADTKAVVTADGKVSYYTIKYDIFTGADTWSIKRSADGYRFIVAPLPDLVDDRAWGLLSIPVGGIAENINDLDPTTGQARWRLLRNWVRQ